MLIFYRYQVNEDGTLTDNDNGRIIWPLTISKGKDVSPFHLVNDENGKRHYFSVKFLLNELGMETEEVVITNRQNHTTSELLDLNGLSSKERVDKMFEALL
jgi:hypothetical protein